MLTAQARRNKELLSLHRKSLTEIAKLNMVNLRARSSTMFNPKINSFEITVFRSDNHNKSFNFYSFTAKSQTEENLESVIKTIKLDSFEEIEKLEITH